MSGRIRLSLILHSHQPVGNFDHVIEEAYRNSYLPYLEMFEQFPSIPLTNHFSGCLLEWIERHRPEYLERLRQHHTFEESLQAEEDPHARRRWEIVGGGFHEPILTMLPARDRVGQIVSFSDWLEQKIGARPRGLWLTERVWEPALVSDLAAAGIEYCTLDDSHFKGAGLTKDDLVGAYVTEDQGQTLWVYPASEKLRYLIPFGQVEEVIAYLRSLLPVAGERVVCYADDGEKFGVWPHTYEHCYRDGWLRNFLTALQRAQEEGWLICSTLGSARDRVRPAGRVYLPENSYREMTEWALPAPVLSRYLKTREALKDDERVQSLLPLIKGGNWRSFRVKYAEGGRMYGKMMEVSRKVDACGADAPELAEARAHLYRGQCNCPYWHGVFGGMYLPHLRMAIYRELILAERIVDRLQGTQETIESCDYDFDGEPEYKLANERLALYLHPTRGGHLYEIDLRDAAFNLGDTFSRRYEAYHDKVAQAIVAGEENGHSVSIHEMVKAKQAGLEKLLNYDAYLRESLVDHLSAAPLTVEQLAGGNPPSDPGFRAEDYEVVAFKPGGNDRPAVLTLRREAECCVAGLEGVCIEVRKTIHLHEAFYTVDYKLVNRSAQLLQASFAVEMNYNLLTGDAHDRYYFMPDNENVGPLGIQADLGEHQFIGLRDHWLNLNLELGASKTPRILVHPVKTVSQSEAGFEAVYQSSCVTMQWSLHLQPGETFQVGLTQEVGRVRED